MTMQFDLLDDGNIDNTTCIMIGAVNQYLISLKKEKRKKKKKIPYERACIPTM